MKKYTDEAVMAAIRAAWFEVAMVDTLDNYMGGGKRITGDGTYTRTIYTMAGWVKGIPGHVLRSRLPKLETQGLLRCHQHRKYGAIRVYPPEQEQKRLIELGRRWWASLGYNNTDILPQVAGHRLPADESEIPS